MQTIEQIKEVVKQAHAAGKKLKLIGYVSSDKSVDDFEIEFDVVGGYTRLLQASIESAKTVDWIKGAPADVAAADWQQALVEQISAWQRSLDDALAMGLSDDHKAYPKFPVRNPDGWWEDKDDPQSIVLRDVVRDTAKPDKGAHKTGVTSAKAWLRNVTPIGRYVGMIILRPGKIQDIQLP